MIADFGAAVPAPLRSAARRLADEDEASAGGHGGAARRGHALNVDARGAARKCGVGPLTRS